jgi:hypothetical protein
VIERPALRATALIQWVVAGSVLVFGLSALVGFVATGEDFDWELAALFGTALGTTLLAAATGALAYSTWSDVRATWELAALTKRDQDERERPVVIQHFAGFNGTPEAGHVSVELVNVGRGPALRVQTTATYVDPAYRPRIATVTWPAMQPGERASFAIPVSFSTVPPDGVKGDGFPLSGSYLDRSQRNEYPIITAWQAGPI